MSVVLELAGVSKSFGSGQAEVHALREVSMAVATGELVAVMGPSGSGKSSLLTIAGTLEQATAGDVVVDGQLVGDLSPAATAALRRHSIGFVFQEYNLLAGLTAAENVAMPLELDGMKARAARAAALTALEHLDLIDRAEHYPDDLSGGERQRVAIARAIVGDRRLLLADEPTGALDSAAATTVIDLLRDQHTHGQTIVMVTHDADVAAEADRVVRLRDGLVVDAAGVTE